MPHIHTLQTERLILRCWEQTDLKPFAALNADKEVMQFFPETLTEDQSNAMARRGQTWLEERGWGFWAVEERHSRQFIGFIGLHTPSLDFPFSPCVEVGWRLARSWWGQGLATEGARAALDFAFQSLDLDEVVSFTSVHNQRSQAVMQRLGMQRAELTFEHPQIPQGHWLREHCLYRLLNARRDTA